VHRYLDGWQEKDTRAAMLFDRAFERALGAYFLRQDAAEVLFREWQTYRNQGLHYTNGNSWDRMLERYSTARSLLPGRSRPHPPASAKSADQVHSTDLIKFEFVAYIDAIGKLDGTGCLLKWKTTSSRYPEEPRGLLALDPQLGLLFLNDRYLRSRSGGIRPQTAG
jgi:hypothetical protein